MRCPKCGGYRTNTFRHPKAKVWCEDCDFVIKDEGSDKYNTYEEELKEVPYSTDDINIIILTEEHLQRVVKEAVVSGIEDYFKKSEIERIIKDLDLGLSVRYGN